MKTIKQNKEKNKKEQNRYLIQILLMIFTILSTMLFTILMLKKNKSIFKESLSMIGNQNNNYLFFVTTTVILFVIFSLLLIMIQKKIGMNTIKNQQKVYLTAGLGIIAVIIPFQKEKILNKHLHNVLSVITAILIINIMLQINKKYKTIKKQTLKLIKHLPLIATAGTLTIFLFTGVNAIGQLFYLSTVIFWTNLIIK